MTMQCRICDGKDLRLALDLGDQPWGNHFLKKDELGREPRYPLRLLHCAKCQAAQLDYTVSKEIMFKNHTYLSGTTATLRNHFAETAQYVDHHFGHSLAQRSVLDIGSNDGTQLQEYQRLGYDVLGVESCHKIAQRAVASGIPTVADFFNLETAQNLERKFGIINASGVFFHLEELHSVTEGIRECLAPEGIFVVQFIYMKQIIANTAFDQVYHEHLLYYTLASIEHLLQRHGLASVDAYCSPVHGGSIILFVRHHNLAQVSERLTAMRALEAREHTNDFATYAAFAHRTTELRTRLMAYLEKAKATGKTIYGMGAPVKGNTLLNYCGINTRYLDYLVEKNPMRAHLYSPGMHIPILLENEVLRQPDIYFVLAWNFKNEILNRYADLLHQGVEFFFPINPSEQTP